MFSKGLIYSVVVSRVCVVMGSNILRKAENAGKQPLLSFPKLFSILSKTDIIILAEFILLFANAFKFLSFGMEFGMSFGMEFGMSFGMELTLST